MHQIKHGLWAFFVPITIPQMAIAKAESEPDARPGIKEKVKDRVHLSAIDTE